MVLVLVLVISERVAECRRRWAYANWGARIVDSVRVRDLVFFSSLGFCFCFCCVVVGSGSGSGSGGGEGDGDGDFIVMSWFIFGGLVVGGCCFLGGGDSEIGRLWC